jgi:AcrR family transcriptional regulator
MMESGSPARKRIVEKATQLLARADQPSIEEIVKAAGVSRTTFYRSFRSRAQLLAELKLEPEPDTRQRVLTGALDSLGTQTLTELSMDELAVKVGISRANLYRLFPGKTALFRALVIAYSPFEPVMALLDRMGSRPPDEVIPELVRTAYRTVAGHTGVLRTLLLEATSMSPEAQQVFGETGLRAMSRLAQYLMMQMTAGLLRRTHPVLALQSLIGPVMFHLLSAQLLAGASIETPSGEAAVVELAAVWLRAMQPEDDRRHVR